MVVMAALGAMVAMRLGTITLKLGKLPSGDTGVSIMVVPHGWMVYNGKFY